MTWRALDSPAIRLFARLGLVAVSACVALLVGAEPREVTLVAGLLAVIALVASAGLPRRVPAWVAPLLECAAAVGLLIAVQPVAPLFLPYLVAPVTAAGLAGGVWPSLAAAAMASFAFIAV